MARSILLSSGIGLWLLQLHVPHCLRSGSRTDHERVLRLPGQTYALAIGQHLRRAACLEVLRVDGELVTVGRLDEVLRADADVRGVEDGPIDGIAAGCLRRGAGLVDGKHPQLLRADAEAYLRLAIERAGRRAEHGAIGEAQ